jgi:threonine dehydrogenase-like Zn-dependent dehydrogenase
MKALYCDSSGIRLSDAEKPKPQPGEALIKVRLAGICRTDLEIAKGYMSFSGIPGHEFVGEVAQLHEADAGRQPDWIGKRVVGEINCGCGLCDLCQSGLERHCPNRTVLGIQGRNGALAEHLTLPRRNLHIVPDYVSDQTAVFTEPLAAALEILEQVQIEPDSRVLVIGDGKLGLLIARILQIRGCHLLCLGSDQRKTEILTKWGIEANHHSDYRPDGRDFVVEASGKPEGFHLALSALKPRGTLIMKSTYHGLLNLDAAALVINEITVIGSRCGPFPQALMFLAAKSVNTDDLITATYPAQDLLKAFEHASKPEALKVLVQFA